MSLLTFSRPDDPDPNEQPPPGFVLPGDASPPPTAKGGDDRPGPPCAAAASASVLTFLLVAAENSKGSLKTAFVGLVGDRAGFHAVSEAVPEGIGDSVDGKKEFAGWKNVVAGWCPFRRRLSLSVLFAMAVDNEILERHTN